MNSSRSARAERSRRAIARKPAASLSDSGVVTILPPSLPQDWVNLLALHQCPGVKPGALSLDVAQQSHLVDLGLEFPRGRSAACHLLELLIELLVHCTPILG